MSENIESENAAVIGFAERRTAHHAEKIGDLADGLEQWVKSAGLDMVQVDRRHLLAAPARMKGRTELHNVQAFCDWVQVHRPEVSGSHARIDVYADLKHMIVTAILDPGSSLAPGWQDYRAVAPLTYTAEWEAWSGLHGRYIDQEKFGQFVADWSHTFVEPTALDMQTLAENLVIHSSSRVAQSVRLRDGTRHIVFDETDETRDADGNDVDVPASVTVRFPIFDDGDIVTLDPQVRFRRRDGKIEFGVHFTNIGGIVRDAFDDAISHVSAALGVVVYAGTEPGVMGP